MPPANGGARPPVMPVTSVPMPVPKPQGAPGWMKTTLGVLIAGVVALGVLALGQSGRIRELEERAESSVLQDNVIYTPEYSEPHSDATAPTDVDVTEPSIPPETLPPLREDLTNRLTAEGVVPDFVKDQLLRLESWNTYTNRWVSSKPGPWEDGMLRDHLGDTLDHTLEILPQPEEPSEPDDQTQADDKIPAGDQEEPTVTSGT